MAVPVFFFGGQFRESFLCGREVEHRIVAKSACPARRFQDLSVRAIRHDGEGAPSFRQRNRTNEVRRTLFRGLTAQLSEKLVDSLRIRPVRPRVPCRMHPGRAAESRHCQSRIIGEDQPFLQPRVASNAGSDSTSGSKANSTATGDADAASARNSASFPGFDDAR